MKINLLLIVLSCLLISWSAFSQTINRCENLSSSPDLYAACLEDKPSVQYEVDQNGNLLIVAVSFQDWVMTQKIYLKSGDGPLVLIKQYSSNPNLTLAVNEIKFAGSDILVSMNIESTSADGVRVRTSSVSIFQKDPLGNYIESLVFEELRDTITTTYGYYNLTYVDNAAYVMRTMRDCPEGDFACYTNPNSTQMRYFKKSLLTGELSEVSGIPNLILNNSRYVVISSGNDLYKQDRLAADTSFKLWIRDYNEGDGYQGGAYLAGDTYYYSYTSSAGVTTLVMVSISDENPKPKKILVADYFGVIRLVDYQPTKKQSALVFRETLDGFRDSFTSDWTFVTEIPGWDHVGLWIAEGDKIYESMPTEPAHYYDPIEDKFIMTSVGKIGVQQFHSIGSFTQLKFGLSEDLARSSSSKAIGSFVIPINEDLAQDLKEYIETKMGKEFHEFQGLPLIHKSYMPEMQKGLNGTYSCIGIIEDAAERRGHNNDQGFIPNKVEKENYGLFTLSSFTPAFLAYWAARDQATEGFENYMIGVLDPVDFVITDSLGRRLGHIDGVTYREIPNAFYSGDGVVETFFIPNVEASYQIKLKGLGMKTISGIKSYYNGSVNELVVNQSLALNEVIQREIHVSRPQVFSPAEIIDRLDRSVVKGIYEAKIKAFMVVAKNIEKHAEENHVKVAKVLTKVLEIELNLFLNNAMPAVGLNKQQAIQHLRDYAGRLK
jgi:hypothetical protein